MTITETKVTAAEIRPGDEIQTGTRWRTVLYLAPTPESARTASDRIGFALEVPTAPGIAGGTTGYYTRPNAVIPIRRHSKPAPSIWRRSAA